MPKKYSDNEKTYIVMRLKQEAIKCLLKYGIKGTTVDLLVELAQIPKGTFYLFFESKEQFLYSVMLEQRNALEMRIFKITEDLKGKEPLKDALCNALFDAFNTALTDDILRISLSDDMELIKRKLPINEVDDDDLIAKMLVFSGVKFCIDIEKIATIIRVMFFGCIAYYNKHGFYDYDAIKLFINGLCETII